MPILSDKNRILLKLFVPQRRRPDSDHAIPQADRNLSGQTMVITGGTDGIGRGALATLYGMGAHVILVGRNEVKGAAVIDALAGGAGTVTFEECDLGSMESVKACAGRILATQSRIDVLVNCAGVNALGKTFAADGFETNWTINYLAPYLLTNLLADRMRDSAPARIVNISTNVAFVESFRIDKIRETQKLATRMAYAEAKLALNMFTIDLAAELKKAGVTVNCLHPGNIQSNLLREMNEGSANRMRRLMQLMASPTEVGADRVVRLAISSEYRDVTGAFVIEDDMSPHHAAAQDPATRAELREMTRELLGQWL